MDSRELAKLALTMAKEIEHLVETKGGKTTSENAKTINPNSYRNKIETSFEKQAIYDALERISSTLANSYKQVRSDISNPNRLSWAGTAHEVREIISNLLRQLAPDDEVKQQPWFTQDSSTSGITQTQRARFILQKKNQGSKTLEVVEKNVNLVDERISELVRSTYNRASSAAHTYRSYDEVMKILAYLDLLIADLIDIE